MGTRWPLSGTMVFDNSGIRAPGAKAYFFEAGTSTPLTTHEDANGDTAHTHPVLADGNGRWPAVFLPFGDYKEQLTTSGGAAIGDVIDDIPNDAPTDPTDTVDANAIFQTGDIIFVGKNGTRPGFVRCNGRTIGNGVSGATERANADTSALFAYLWDNYANGQAAVSGGRGGSAAADYAAGKTIALPNGRSVSLIGFDDMGNTAAGLVASAPVVSGSGILAGSLLGANTVTLTTFEMPTHTHPVNFNSQAGTNHTHPISITSGAGSAHSHGLVSATVTGDGSHAHGATINPGGAHAHTVNGGTTRVVGDNFSTTVDDTGGAGTAPKNAHTLTIDAAVDHTHTATVTGDGSHTHDVGGTTDNEALHTHLVSGNSGGESAHTHNIIGATDAAGVASAVHNNLQRSMPVTVLIKL